MTAASATFIVALVGAVGSPLSEASRELEAKIKAYGYRVHVLKLSDAFAHPRGSVGKSVDDGVLRTDPYAGIDGRYRDIRRAMAVGNAARELCEFDDSEKSGCLGYLAVHAISGLRQRASAKTCCIVHSLKTPAELELLRRIYGQRLLVIALHTPREERFARLVEQIQYSMGRSPTAEECATRLIGIDESERGTRFGQNVEGVFGRSDVFLSATAADARLRQQVDRLVRLMFLDPFETATPDEAAMAAAYDASLRSASLARNVGAAITTRQGDLISLGFNEVHQFGGIPYTSSSSVDGRDFTRGHDENAVQKRALMQQILQTASEQGLLRDGETVEAALDKIARAPQTRDMLARNITEFAREVHAEMAAICSAAKRGVSVQNGILYSTTFPCHNCAKHILACGLAEVVFIEAYPKSFAGAFYRDAVALDRSCPDKLLIRAFFGVGPRAYQALFEWRERRSDADGSTLVPDPATAKAWFTLRDHLSEEELTTREESVTRSSKEILDKVFNLEEVVKVLQKASPGPRKGPQSTPPAAVESSPSQNRKRTEER